MSEQREHALDLMASLNSAAGWLNKLDRLFAVVRDESVKLAEGGINVDELLAAVEAFRLEFYGREDGSDHPDALPVSDLPAEVGDMEAKIRALLDGVSLGQIPHGIAAIVVSHPNADTTENDYVHQLARRLRDAYPDPKPLIILNPGDATDIGYMDEEAMRKAGWQRIQGD